MRSPQSKSERKPMSEELKRAWAHWSALSLDLSATQAKLAELQERTESLQKQVSEADAERTRLGKLEGFL